MEKESYLGFDIIADKKKNNSLYWTISLEGKHYLSDTRTIDGDKLQGERHAINDAKKNIDTAERLEKVKLDYIPDQAKIDEWQRYQINLFKNWMK